MANLVVYVPVRVERALEAMGISPDVQRRACVEVLTGLSENGGLGSGEVKRAGVGQTGPLPETPAAVSPVPSPCSRAARHHTNHGGRPCPECGWPTVT